MPSPDRYRNTLWYGLATWIGAATMLTWLSYGHAARRIYKSSEPAVHFVLGPWPKPVLRSPPAPIQLTPAKNP
jgi:hypothetical protein